MITPPVGGRTSIRWAFIFAGASLLAACVMGLGVFAMGSAVRSSETAARLLTIVIFALAVALAADTALGPRIPVLTGRWVVPRRWGAYGGDAFAALFGFSLGLGWRTQVGSNLFWLVLATAALAPRFASALLPFALFAVVRAVPIISVSVARAAAIDDDASRNVEDVKGLRAVARSSVAARVSVAAAAALAATTAAMV